MTQLIFLFILATAPAIAAEPACPALSSPQSVLDCVLRVHPAAKGSAALLLQAEALGSAAGQRPNPEAAGTGVFGDSQDQMQVSLLHTFETGGKRGRRLDRARAEALELGAEALSVKEEIAVDTVSDLFRLRQIREELKLLQEALDTFSRIARQLRARPRRSPEQEVSLSVFQLAERDYSVKRSALEGETLALRRELELGLGAPLPDSDSVLPARRTQWPDLGAPGSPRRLCAPRRRSRRRKPS
jgi:outer membrane protein TolC